VIWAGWLDRRLRAQSAVLARQSQEDAIRERRLARQEQQRSHILELINSPESLPEVLAEIRAMVSSRLFGASCWFELSAPAGGSTELVRPSAEGVVFQEMFAPDGTNLGLLLATPLPRSASDAEIAAALTAGARLAELAIDTRRLYSDLRHRSEYDLLTDIPNRFSMEKHLDRLMQGTNRRDADGSGRFGLIYVDLDKFKQINDRFGHRAGDHYLQAVTGRMKFQLRNGDILARIGGDEFIALVPILRSRVDAEEIAMRLERCFDEPFEIEGYKVYGSASVGLAVYPEDGSTKEDLQRAADAFMYAHKESKKQQEKVAEAMQRVWREDLPN
jgi:diguanylate cyclase (GGDEF)-like protein